MSRFLTALKKLNPSTSFMRTEINPAFQALKPQIEQLPAQFKNMDQAIHKARNEIKIWPTDSGKMVIKNFGKIYLANRFVYAWIRSSKAERSYKNAVQLSEKGIHTPEPVAYLECFKSGMLHESMFIYRYCDSPQNMRKVLAESGYPDRINILYAFAQFTFQLVRQDVYHRDYSPGNILFEKTTSGYDFSIIDINRLSFEKMDGEKKYWVFRRLFADETTLRIIAEEYAKLCNEDPQKVAERILYYSQKFKNKKLRKKSLKQWLRIK